MLEIKLLVPSASQVPQTQQLLGWCLSCIFSIVQMSSKGVCDMMANTADLNHGRKMLFSSCTVVRIILQDSSSHHLIELLVNSVIFIQTDR